jgi:3-hydroxyacyl-CoA dehydrogenase
MSEPVNFSVRGRVAVATVDHPPVNALSQSVRAGLIAALDRLESDSTIGALVVVCAGKTFFSGADIKEFGKPLQPPFLGDVIARLEGSNKLTVAAIHGKALGGGLELALACHYRVAVDGARIGLPEVKLGLIPGAGGTQRLPRVVGLATGLRVVAEGAELGAAEARERGAIDEILSGNLTDDAVAFAERLLASGASVRRTMDLPPPPAEPGQLAEARKALARKFRGQTAPQAAVDAIELMYSRAPAEALHEEHEICLRLLHSPQSQALRHMFASERVVGRVPGLDGVSARDVRRVGIIGLGTMGAGMTQVFANAGYEVVAFARSDAAVERAMAAIRKAYAGQVSRGSIDQATADRRLAAIAPTTDHATFANVELVCESVSEVRDQKRAVFEMLGRATRPGCVLTSNTSYLDIDDLAAASGRPADVCGLHFFNPAPVMRLVEVVRAEGSSSETLATTLAVAKKIGKLPIVTGICDGFVVNRLLARRSREAAFMLEEGATPSQVDRALLEFGFPMGPYALSDLAGIDLQFAARNARRDRLTPRERQADFVDQLHALGRFGQKTGAGWYRYDENRKASPDPAIDELLAAHSRRRGLERRAFEDHEILRRCLYAMVNEGARLIDEGVVARPDEIDVAMVNGIGFPAYTGGPMWWADSVGLANVAAAMRGYAASEPVDWTPAPLLERLAQSGGRFYPAA